jgi:hypothetical protein
MTDTQDTDRLANAKAQGQAQFDSIVEMVQELTITDDDDEPDEERRGAAEQAIHDDALSVEVRSDWYTPGGHDQTKHNVYVDRPAEYRILLCTGGPAVQIVGTLSEHSEPETAHLEVQDWFTPWTEIRPRYRNSHNLEAPDWHEDTEAAKEILLTYARCFWFGE